MKKLFLLLLAAAVTVWAELPRVLEYKNGKTIEVAEYTKWAHDRVTVKLARGGVAPVMFHHLTDEQARVLRAVAGVQNEAAAERQRERAAQDREANRLDAAANDGSVSKGMTVEQVQRAWGRAERINASTGSYGRHEQHVYTNYYVYFENGIVTGWSNR